jgi:hypothetical protein
VRDNITSIIKPIEQFANINDDSINNLVNSQPEYIKGLETNMANIISEGQKDIDNMRKYFDEININYKLIEQEEGKVEVKEKPKKDIPIYVYIISGIIGGLLLIVIVYKFRNKKNEQVKPGVANNPVVANKRFIPGGFGRGTFV